MYWKYTSRLKIFRAWNLNIFLEPPIIIIFATPSMIFVRNPVQRMTGTSGGREGVAQKLLNSGATRHEGSVGLWLNPLRPSCSVKEIGNLDAMDLTFVTK